MVFQGAMNVLNPVLKIGDAGGGTAPRSARSHDKKAAISESRQLLERVGLPQTFTDATPMN